MEDFQMSNRNFQLKNVPKMTGETKEDLVKMILCLIKSEDSTVEIRDILDIYRICGTTWIVLTDGYDWYSYDKITLILQITSDYSLVTIYLD